MFVYKVDVLTSLFCGVAGIVADGLSLVLCTGESARSAGSCKGKAHVKVDFSVCKRCMVVLQAKYRLLLEES